MTRSPTREHTPGPGGLEHLPGLSAVRRFYWKRLRRYRAEICGSVTRGTDGEAVVRKYGCGRPVGVVWRAQSEHWHRVVTGGKQLLEPEGAGGILCVPCFDRASREAGEACVWVAGPLAAEPFGGTDG